MSHCLYGRLSKMLKKSNVLCRTNVENKAIMSNLITELHNSSPTQCSYVCLQQKCECFGFESNTKTCRIHAFCRLYSTSVDEAGWKYYRSGQCCNFSFAQILYFAVVFNIANVILNHILKYIL